MTHLQTTFPEELVPCAERYLDETGEFDHLFGSVVLNVRDTLTLMNIGRRITRQDAPQSTQSAA